MVIKILLLSILFLLIVSCLMQRRVLFPRHMIPAPNMDGPPPEVEVIWIESPQGPVEAWYRPGNGVSPEAPGPAVIYAHGNGELIDCNVDRFEPYHRMGVSVLLAGYRGYGRSAGSPSQRAITDDFIKFHDTLVARREVDANRIVYHGRSLGGGVVCALASFRKPAALILQSTFTSVPDVVRHLLFPRFLVLDPFDNHKVVSQLECPILLIHGREDKIIPFAHGEALHAIASQSELVGFVGGHNEQPPIDLYWPMIERFIRNRQILGEP